MDYNFKFDQYELVRVINVDGDGDIHTSCLSEYIGLEGKIISRMTNSNCNCYYLNHIRWWFYEWNLEVVEKGFNAEDIIRKAFGLGG